MATAVLTQKKTKPKKPQPPQNEKGCKTPTFFSGFQLLSIRTPVKFAAANRHTLSKCNNIVNLLTFCGALTGGR